MKHERKQVLTTTVKPYWSDMDALGHINNAKYLTYFEEARIIWLKNLGMDASSWESAETGPVIINANCNFHKMVKYPAELEITVFVGKPGRSTFLIEYEVTDGNGICATGNTKTVWVDFDKGRPVPLPDFVRTALISEASNA